MEYINFYNKHFPSVSIIINYKDILEYPEIEEIKQLSKDEFIKEIGTSNCRLLYNIHMDSKSFDERQVEDLREYYIVRQKLDNELEYYNLSCHMWLYDKECKTQIMDNISHNYIFNTSLFNIESNLLSNHMPVDDYYLECRRASIHDVHGMTLSPKYDCQFQINDMKNGSVKFASIIADPHLLDESDDEQYNPKINPDSIVICLHILEK